MTTSPSVCRSLHWIPSFWVGLFLISGCGSSGEGDPQATATPPLVLVTPTPEAIPIHEPVLQAEICDGLDNDLDGEVDEGFDQDGDGVAGGEACVGHLPEGIQIDCNDTNAEIYPGHEEHCDGVDEDCDRVIDEDPIDGQYFCKDRDGDGAYGGESSLMCAGQQGYGMCTDCNDLDSTIHPKAPELCDGIDSNCDGYAEMIDHDGTVPEVICDGIDNDCDGHRDEGFDSDGDSYATSICDPDAVAPYDCDDTDSSIHPSAIEVCNGIDDDCNNVVDDDSSDGGPWYYDADHDSYGSTSIGSTQCIKPAGYTAVTGDCNDRDADISPAMSETCNNIDDDCDVEIDEDYDVDQDGFVDQSMCEVTLPVGTLMDCDDGNPGVHPYALERCDDVDDNCDTIVDPSEDQDQDGYSVCGTEGQTDDCDDLRGDVHPGQAEILDDGVDDNCDGIGDADIVVCRDPDRGQAGVPTTDTIQEAIDLATTDDIVLICPGRYRESLVVDGVPSTLMGWTRRENVVILPPQHTRGVIIRDVQLSEAGLVRLTLDGQGRKSLVEQGGGVWIVDSLARITDVAVGHFFLEPTVSRGSSCPQGGSGCSSSVMYAPTWGAGVAISEASEVLVSRSSLTDNRAMSGGAIAVRGGRLTLVDSQLTGNVAYQLTESYWWDGNIPEENQSYDGKGGAIFIDGNVVTSLDHCQLDANEAIVGGGVYDGGISLDVSHSSLTNNIAYGVAYSSDSGRSTYTTTCYAGVGGGLFTSGDLNLCDVAFSFNRAIQGGALASASSSTTLQDVKMEGNSAYDVLFESADNGQSNSRAKEYLGEGGGIWQQGGVLSARRLSVELGIALKGGALFLSGVETDLSNSVVNGVTADGLAEDESYGSPSGRVDIQRRVGDGGAIYAERGSLNVDQLAISDATALRGGGLYLHEVDAALSRANLSSMKAGGVASIVTSYEDDPTEVSTTTEYQGEGGAIYAEGGSLDIDQFMITDTHADIQGGAITFLPGESGGALTLGAGAIIGTSAPEGAGIFADVGEAGTADFTSIILAYTRGGESLTLGETSPASLSYSGFYDNEGGHFTWPESQPAPVGMTYTSPSFMSLDLEGDPSQWDLHLSSTSTCVNAGPPNLFDPDGSRADIGPYGGPGANSWDLDGDSWPQAWAPGSTSSTPGYDCDDLDPTVFPGQGCP